MANHHHAGLPHSSAKPSSSKSASMSANIVGVHYRVGKKVGEGSFGVLYEGTISPLKALYDMKGNIDPCIA